MSNSLYRIEMTITRAGLAMLELFAARDTPWDEALHAAAGCVACCFDGAHSEAELCSLIWVTRCKNLKFARYEYGRKNESGWNGVAALYCSTLA